MRSRTVMRRQTMNRMSKAIVIGFVFCTILVYSPTFAQNYCPDTTIVVGSPSVGEEQSATISTPQWDQNAHNLSAICRGEVTPKSTSLPATCTVGQIFFDTDAAVAGNNLFGCTSTNTWTLLGDGGSGGGSSNSFSTIDTSSGTDPVADSSTDTLILSGTSPVVVTGDSLADSVTLSLSQNAGTDITSDLEEETHAAEHHQAGGDELAVESLASVCGAGATIEGDGAGGVQCGTDDTGTDTDDQTAVEVPITDAGAFYTGADVETALQEIGPTMTDARTPDAHVTTHAENGSDELLIETLGTSCADGEIIVANPTGGVACGSAGSASFTTLSGDYGDEVVTSVWDLSGAIVELPNSTAPLATDCDTAGEAGRIHVDTDAPTGQQLYVCEGVAGWVLTSGSGSGEYDPDNAPSAGLVAPSYEFSDSVPSCTWANQGSSTWSASMDTALLDIVAIDSTEQARVCYLGAPPSGDWTSIAKVSVSVATGTGNIRFGYMALLSGTEASPTSLHTSLCGWFTSNKEWSCGPNSYTSYAFANGVNHGVHNLWDTTTSSLAPPTMCLRLQHDDTADSLSMSVAYDCMTWQVIGSHTGVSNSPSNLGFFLSSMGVTRAPKLRVHWVRTFASLTDESGE